MKLLYGMLLILPLWLIGTELMKADDMEYWLAFALFPVAMLIFAIILSIIPAALWGLSLIVEYFNN